MYYFGNGNENTIIFLDDSIIKEYDINNFYDKLISELSGFRLLYFCEKNYNKIYDNIEIINKQFSLDKNWSDLLFKNIKFNHWYEKEFGGSSKNLFKY